MLGMLDIMKLSPVIPVVTVTSVDQAVAMARDLYAGGIKTMEVTCRTPTALDAAKAIARRVPDLCLGLGTVWTGSQAQAALDAGAQFIVSPGIADEVGALCRAADCAYLPGAQTVSEVAYLRRQGWQQVKLFPADAIGGPSAIKAYAAVLSDMHFCPTGGITEANASEYLALDCVPCVGGSWLTRDSGDAMESQANSPVRAAAARAVRLVQGFS